MLNRQITDKEYKTAERVWFLKSKPYIHRLAQLNHYLNPKIIKTENEVKFIYVETEESLMIKEMLYELSNQIKIDLYNGEFL